MAQITEKVDVCVIGAGHAGCEAALACARMGLETVIFTVSIESIALMPCNPNIGGSSKGHLVRELDALGGEMGKISIIPLFSQRCSTRRRVLQCIRCGRRRIKRNTADGCGRFWKIRSIWLSSRQKFAIFYGMMWMQTRFPEKLVQRKNPWCADIYGNGIRSQSGYFVYRNLLKGTLPVRRIHYLYRAERTAGGKSPDRQPERNGHCDAPFQDGNACENG